VEELMNKSLAPLLSMLFLALASISCTIFVGGPEAPPTTVPVSIEAADSIKEEFKRAVEAGVTTGTITLQLNESQLTSLLAIKLAAQSKPFMTEPQVLLRNGEMQIFGKVKRGIFVANIAMVVSVGVDEAGRPKIDVTSVDFGPLPAPAGLKSAISALVAEAYTGALGPIATGFRLESIAIADGFMTLSGRIK
jgi:hypothetical protein